ncbi:MAG TPA: NAD-dependent epimerase/dehydratase family protein [Kofleriaceae bacterium]|jgi:nucleoside-diphosphate-sugar epimerase|nr:NAD-dependent epimerase/dehydratase family protein [Kofleriaceae bacterium]
MTGPWLILGCGYTGTQLARTLVARPELAGDITITRRDGEVARALGAALGVRGERAELAELARPARAGGLKVPPGAIVVCLAPPGEDPAGEIRGLVAATRTAARIVYVSSTGVYGPGHGAWVDEAWPIAPITESGRARAAAEAALAEATVPWVALRAAGIYGPGRGLIDRIRAGTYRVIGDGTSHVGRIHVVDLVAAILAAGTTSITGPVNVADDDPAPIGEVSDAIAARLGLPPPPRVPVAAVSPEVAGMLTADRRIANHRLRHELGVALRYPSWRDALASALTAAAP